ncbi:UvrD-helicase domain-containing protein [Rodentibacter myodis]|uniref:DNA 3'-5' helicase II n=1 Tax=Rodentibacter myodis TaxID=1907939 RepID=A0A1V3JTS7_9PAST|nr:UvrD-helicase domain-containing protein [Rodentibacter myodis]OOF60120.1 hypothetical protein BKL49_00025 [Rodentibacter myodis]
MSNTDNEIFSYVTQDPPKSFLLFAGAGSGKTRTLVSVLEKIKNEYKTNLIKQSKQVKVITFTNAACDEIKHRLRYDSTFSVSTIHSFAWDFIKPFTKNIKDYLEEKINGDIIDLTVKISKAKSENSQENYKKDLRKKQDRLNNLQYIDRFIYSPIEILVGKGTLNHSEVISIFAKFLREYPLMKNILISQHPILFIDECQDTQKELLIALIETQKAHSEEFCLGLFGDLTQQIYSSGYPELVKNLPEDWKKPSKEYNYRCPTRIVDLINKIGHINNTFIPQTAKQTEEGLLRLFILKECSEKKLEKEQFIRERMSSISSDSDWINIEKVKTLVLEHSMAAKRGGFEDFFLPLSKNNIIKDNLLQNTGSHIQFLLQQFLPLIDSIQENKQFNLMRILEKYSPRMVEDKIENNFVSLKDDIKNFYPLVKDDSTLNDILSYVYDKEILEIPDDIKNGLNFDKQEYEKDDKDFLWNQALKSTLSQLKKYSLYAKGELGFDTHQGVKGLEFPRVMAILDDSDSNGFLFKYNKLIGVELLSDTDKKNITSGKDNVLTRTARLFYVICSRAQKSLAVVVYTSNPEDLKQKAINLEWFTENEIEIIE